jgi:hypothetical protein
VPRFIFLSLIVWLASFVIRAQSNFSFVQSIPVEVNGQPLPNPWAGGLNSAQINSMDLDFDGDEDLAVFDRTANKLFPFLRSGTHYVYAPDYEAFFPTLTSWILLRDFNGDGKKDLFTGNIAGISVYVNVSSGATLKWRPFNNGFPLLTQGFNGPVNLKVNLTDIPAIDDVDGDGDFDILNARFVGVGTIEYHQNMSMENTGRRDSMQMARISQEWGGFEECNCGKFAFNGIDCTQLPGGRVQHDAGKSLLTLDVNNDGVRDLLFSEQNCTSLYGLINQGTNALADVETYQIFPPTNASNLLFPAAFYEDVDFDDTNDLIISSNISSTVFSNLDFSNSVWQYKNTGTELLPQFSFVKSNFLQESMIDVGSYAAPSFADADRDGDLDMFVSYWSGADTISSIYQYENTGTLDQPAFKLITKDYLQFSKFEFYNIKIQFIDVNRDGKTDLAFTATSKKTHITQLYFLFNQSSGVFDFTSQLPVATGVQIDQAENVSLVDITKDGLPDMLVGKVNGSLQYWINAGTANSFFPVLSSQAYLGLGSSIIRYCISTSMVDLKQDGKPDLLVGNKGSLVIFSDFQSAQNAVVDTVYVENALKGIYENRNLGGAIQLTTADLYFNFSPLVFVGTISGGIYVLKPEKINSLETLFFLWPNPAITAEDIHLRSNQNVNVQIFNIIGQKIGDSFLMDANETYSLNHSLAAGMYVARVSFPSKTMTLKFIIR